MKINYFILTVFLIFSFESIIINGQLTPTADGSCGTQGKSQTCGDSFCCSPTGYCGGTVKHCGEGCQVDFGKCGGGTPVSTPKVPGITKCKEHGTFAVTFDDGPGEYTHALLDYLKLAEVKATFFVTGNFEKCIYEYADVLTRAKNEGHQIAHHTWSHADAATLTREQLDYQVKKLEVALLDILGVKPKYFRLPFGSGFDNGFVMDHLADLGYTVIQWDVDSNDWRNYTIEQSLEAYNNATGVPDAHISLNHDRIENTALNLGPRAIEFVKSRKFKLTTVGQCLGDGDPKDWYTIIQEPKKNDPNTWFCTPDDKTGQCFSYSDKKGDTTWICTPDNTTAPSTT